VTLYLDTSSLVKLYVAEPESESVRLLVDSADIVATAAIAYPEARAALARRRRDGGLRPRAFTATKRALDDDWPRYLAVDVTAALCRDAGDLAERHRLRGYDGVHLAAYLQVARAAGKAHVRFSCFDDRLTAAARSVARTLRPGVR
jgi:predicted nucleic acid-binding protein